MASNPDDDDCKTQQFSPQKRSSQKKISSIDSGEHSLYWSTKLCPRSKNVNYDKRPLLRTTKKSPTIQRHNDSSCRTYFNRGNVSYLRMLLGTLNDPGFHQNSWTLVAVTDPTFFMNHFDQQLQKLQIKKVVEDFFDTTLPTSLNPTPPLFDYTVVSFQKYVLV